MGRPKMFSMYDTIYIHTNDAVFISKPFVCGALYPRSSSCYFVFPLPSSVLQIDKGAVIRVIKKLKSIIEIP